MGAGGSTEEATELERQRRSGDMTKAGVWRVSHFHRLVMFYKKEWTHEVSGRVHHNRKFQRLAWNLEKLDLRDNVLKYFANPSAKRLKALREIDLSQNRFKRFPKDAFAPPNIEIVRICENKIRNVRLPPPSLLTTLVELHLDNNRIMELPDAFIDFESLEVLSLSSNGFVDMPDVVLELDTLKQLLMEQNAMWFLPQTFNQLEKLEVLALNANNFEMMPRVLCDMDNLVDLRLGRNGITSLMRGETIQTTLDNGQVITMVVETFVLMSALRKLTVAMNELSDLPPDIWDVKLDHLNLRNNEIEGELPVEIVKLKETLVELYLDENALTALPPCLTDFPLLTRLTVNGNKLTMLPKMPPQLEELLAAENDLDFLPDGLYQPKRREENHTKLSILDVRGNSRLAYPPPSYLLRGEEIGEYLEKLADPDISINPVTGLRVVEESRNHVELDSYGNEIKASSHVDESKMSSKEERLRRTFAAIDEDDSGVIERKEFRRLMKRLAPQMDKEEVDTVFDEIDTDGGGDLDFEEFSGWWDSDIGKAFRQEQRDVRDNEAEEAAAEEEANGDTPADGAASPAGADSPGSPGSPWTPDRVAQWVANGGDINAAPANIVEAAGIDVPHYQKYGKVDSTLLAAAKQEKTAPLKYQEKRALIKAQRKLEAEQAQARAEAEARGEDVSEMKTPEEIAAELEAAEEAEAKRVQQERVDAVRERFRKGVKKQLKASAAEAAADKLEAEEEAVAAELERIRVEQEEASGVHQLKEAGFTAVEAVPSPATKKGELAAGSDDGASPTNGKQLWAKVGQNGRVTAKIDIFSSPKSETAASPNRELPVHSPTRNSPKKEKKDKKDKKRKKRRKKQKNGAADKYEVEVDDGEAEAEVVSPALAKQLRKNGIQNQLRKNGSPLTGLSPVAVGTVRGKARARKGSGHSSPQRSNGHDDGAHPFAVDADEDEGQADGGWEGEEQHEEEEEEEEEPEPEQVWSSSSDEEPEPVFVRELVVALP